MAKRPTTKDLSPQDQALYDALPDFQKNQVDQAAPENRSAILQGIVAQNQKAAQEGARPSYNTSQNSGFATEVYFEKALGVEGGRTVSKTTNAPVEGTYTGFRAGTITPYGTLQRTPKYFERDVDLIAKLGREQIAIVQAQMKRAGVISSNYRAGIADDVTKAGFKTLLEQANNSGADWRSTLAVLEATPAGGTGKLPPKVSNPDDLKRIIQQSAQYVLGRDLDDVAADQLVRTYQQMQVKQQTTGFTSNGMRTDLPDAQTFAQKRIEKQAGPEAQAYKFAKFADSIFGGE